MSDVVTEGVVIRKPTLHLPALKDDGLGDNENLTKFLETIAKSLRKQQAVAGWHISLFAGSQGKIELPYRHDDTSVYANQYNRGYYWKDTDELCDDQESPWKGAGDREYEYRSIEDLEATVTYLALITQVAKKRYPGVFIEKKYNDSNFALHFTIPIHTPTGETEKVTIMYNTTRSAVCKKKVVGTETIEEEVIPAHTRDIVEWECEPVSLMGHDTGLDALDS